MDDLRILKIIVGNMTRRNAVLVNAVLELLGTVSRL